MKKVRVLVVDDSALMRRVIGDIIQEHPDLELAATARDGLDALGKIKSDRPDVITMDLEMPRLGGLETLHRIMSEYALPVIMLSSHTRAGNENTIKALEAGAVDFISKPVMTSPEEAIGELKAVLPQKILTASTARLNLVATARPVRVEKVERKIQPSVHAVKARVIVAIGASTGGAKALEALFSAFPADLPAAVLVSQHMPPGFTLSFSQRLDQMSSLAVKEAEEGDALLTGRALVAPGGFHLVVRGGAVHLDSGPKVNYVKPSIDVMLDSLAGCDQKVIVVIMTGMGKDGAAGAVNLKKVKNNTVVIVQDPATALIPSMPEAVLKNNICDTRVATEKMAAEIDRYVQALQ